MLPYKISGKRRALHTEENEKKVHKEIIIFNIPYVATNKQSHYFLIILCQCLLY